MMLRNALLTGMVLAFSTQNSKAIPVSQERQIQRAGSDLCLTLLNGSKRQGARFHVAKCEDIPSQKWVFYYHSTGGYTIRPLLYEAEMCVDLFGMRTEDETPIFQYPCHGQSNQVWKFKRIEADKYLIVNLGTGKCLDTALGLTTHQYTCDANNPNQVFVIED